MNPGHSRSGMQAEGGDPRIAAFWKRYAAVLEAVRIPERGQVWFRRVCERFIGWLQPTRLAQNQREQVLEYLKYLEGTRLDRWQLEQASDAVRYLLADVVRLPWAKSWVIVTWSEDLPDSESIQRGLELHWERRGRSEAFQQVRERFRNELERVVTTLRVRHYAYRTEQTYLEWAYRFLVFCGAASGEGISETQVREFLNDLALRSKYPNAPREWAWQWVFPADRVALDPRSGKVRRTICIPPVSRGR